MIIQLDKNHLFNTFGVSSFKQLEENTNTMAPSMVEYYLSDLASVSHEGDSYINKSNIQHTITLDEYSLYLDYNEDTYLEFIENNDIYETGTLW